MKEDIPTISPERLAALSLNASSWMERTRKESAAACKKSHANKERLLKFKDDAIRRSVASDARMFREGGKLLSMQRENIPGFAENEPEIRLRTAIRSALYKARELSGLSQKEIGKKLGIPQPNVSRIEQLHNATIKSLSAYLAACGCTVEIAVKKIAAK